MSALAAGSGTVSVVRFPRQLGRRFRRNRSTAAGPAVAPTNYIPYSTADMWRSSRRSFSR